MRRILLLGPPGSGKSTQGQMLADVLGYKWVSTGELLRSSKEPWVVEKLKTAELFPDEMIFQLLSSALSGVDGAILDGAVRTKAQAIRAVSPEIGLDMVVELDVPREELVRRVLERGREQDSPEVISERLDEYEQMKAEILEVFAERGIEVVRVDGVGTPEEVFNRLKNKVKEER